MVKDFVQGNIHPLLREIRQMHMDAADLQTRHDKLVHEHKALQARYELLEARAAAVIWLLPEDVEIGDLQQIALEFSNLRRREKERQESNRRAIEMAIDMAPPPVLDEEPPATP